MHALYDSGLKAGRRYLPWCCTNPFGDLELPPESSRTTPVLLLHGWLGGAHTFAALPTLLKSIEHVVLPSFLPYPTQGRRITLEQLADRLEQTLRAEAAWNGAPLTVLAHSMGTLVARVWMRRHYLDRGLAPPVRLFIECGAPRHGVFLKRAARAMVRWGLVPGAGLAQAMLAPQPWLWDLAWAERAHETLLPPMVALTSVLRRSNWLAPIIGGRDSDGIVPLACSQPNPWFARPGAPAGRLRERPFRVLPDYAHSSHRGLLQHLRADGASRPIPPDDPVWALLRKALLGETWSEVPEHAPEAHAKHALWIVRHGADDLRLEAGRIWAPKGRHPSGLALFAVPVAAGTEAVLRGGGKAWSAAELGLTDAWRAGAVAYVDLA